MKRYLFALTFAAAVAAACFDVSSPLPRALPQRGLEVIIKRFGAREVRTDARRRGPVTQAIHREDS